jgi:hypothetical protein
MCDGRLSVYGGVQAGSGSCPGKHRPAVVADRDELGIAPSMLSNWRGRAEAGMQGRRCAPNTPMLALNSAPDPGTELFLARRENERRNSYAVVGWAMRDHRRAELTMAIQR